MRPKHTSAHGYGWPQDNRGGFCRCNPTPVHQEEDRQAYLGTLTSKGGLNYVEVVMHVNSLLTTNANAH